LAGTGPLAHPATMSTAKNKQNAMQALHIAICLKEATLKNVARATGRAKSNSC
jgi:hypothetical protein